MGARRYYLIFPLTMPMPLPLMRVLLEIAANNIYLNTRPLLIIAYAAPRYGA